MPSWHIYFPPFVCVFACREITKYRAPTTYMYDYMDNKAIHAGQTVVEGFYMLDESERALFARHNITILEVPWSLPPGLSKWVGGCAMKDLIRLHVFNMTEYDAVAYLDFDVHITGDILPIFDCAASGEFMMAQGLVAPLNAGIMVR